YGHAVSGACPGGSLAGPSVPAYAAGFGDNGRGGPSLWQESSAAAAPAANGGYDRHGSSHGLGGGAGSGGPNGHSGHGSHGGSRNHGDSRNHGGNVAHAGLGGHSGGGGGSDVRSADSVDADRKRWNSLVEDQVAEVNHFIDAPRRTVAVAAPVAHPAGFAEHRRHDAAPAVLVMAGRPASAGREELGRDSIKRRRMRSATPPATRTGVKAKGAAVRMVATAGSHLPVR
ncbi:unnamed protein product, partial [Phaeothamnion confervicola]